MCVRKDEACLASTDLSRGVSQIARSEVTDPWDGRDALPLYIRWLRTAALVSLVLLLALTGSAGSAHADSTISITSTQVQISFPTSVTFTLAASAPAPITQVGLQVNTPGKSYGAIPLDVQATFTSGLSVNAAWSWQSPGPGINIPPGVEISYRWTLKDADGVTMQTDLKTVRYEDSRYAWKALTAPGLELHWYEGDAAFGQQLVQAATDGLTSLHTQQGVDLKSQVAVWIYSTQAAMRGAMIGSPVWIGGRSYPDFSTILLIIGPGGLAEGRKALVHEMTHQAVYQQTFNPLIGSQVPLWLNEGLAVTSEGPTTPTFAEALRSAVAANRLPSFRTIDSAFPPDPQASNLAYAQSESIVRYLLKQYGAVKMRDLLGVFQLGSRVDAALQKVYGMDLDQLQDSWRQSVGAKPLGHAAVASGAAAVATLQPLTVPKASASASGSHADSPPALALFGGLAAIALLLVAGMGMLIRGRT